MAVMTVDEREKFLAEERVGMLAVSREGAAPLAVPVWYDYSPGGEVLISTRRSTVKYRALEAAGQLSLAVQRETPPYRYVTVSGPVAGLESLTDEQALRIAARYLPDAEARAFVAGSVSEDSVLIRVRPEKWLSGNL
ncbi:pyridoxamine 5'-phosphate oxidase family protein [Amycolatopsis jiangsuensis]|uniref:PPOX class probable F420-dependent enzyme n=1 Tax=Amycolatopsis jiangsuensis TaxID=1181879 RepID=A0A840J0S4_9PSEU|nr:pyridoxamine 5'-phosphate oxidase family protein [Amycolatopsis jiangsuensis]MBB4687533.1 PPOX class probable F420-dependent enzyme [Amycolatopsis jiangsuensis]